jgi:GrpB-like predicted nucleotidyltransferase (UPF0157 family)
MVVRMSDLESYPEVQNLLFAMKMVDIEPPEVTTREFYENLARQTAIAVVQEPWKFGTVSKAFEEFCRAHPECRDSYYMAYHARPSKNAGADPAGKGGGQ